MNAFFLWFSGGPQQYHTLVHCLRGQWFWITTTVTLDIAVAIGYAVIASHWYRNERTLPASPARQALATMRNIFAFCGICGYLFIPVKLFWPAWRLYDLFMLALVFFTWRYALNVRGLKVLYTAVGKSDQLETELTTVREDARRQSAFLNAISHDLRTPLNGLMLNANLAEIHLDGDDRDPAAVATALAQIKAAARLTTDLLDGLLEYARMDGTGEPLIVTKFSMSDLVESVLSAHRPTAPRGVQLSAAVPASLSLSTDRLRLERVLSNLIGNAIKYTRAGSVRVSVESADTGTEVHVTDTGVGIAPDHVGRLFDEFYQVQNHERDRQKGFGLGLAIAKRLAGQLGGDLVVTSEPGRGSRFTVTLPPVPPATPVATGGRTGGAAVNPGGRSFVLDCESGETTPAGTAC